MTLRIRDAIEMGDYVLLVEGKPSPVRIYLQHFGTVAKVERKWDGSLATENPEAILPTVVIDAVLELFEEE